MADTDGSKWIYRNQIDYLTDASGTLLVDFIGRFETLPQDFKIISEKIAFAPTPLPHVNKSVRKQYTDYYTSEMAETVRRRFQRDIEHFGYAFGR